jgi:hypothetical protein
MKVDSFEMDGEQLLAMIKIGVSAAGSQKAFAESAGISSQYLCDVLKGRREVGQRILDMYGLERVITYRKTEK